MGLLEFSKLPVNTLVGADWDTFKKMTDGQNIGSKYKNKYYLTSGSINTNEVDLKKAYLQIEYG